MLIEGFEYILKEDKYVSIEKQVTPKIFYVSKSDRDAKLNQLNDKYGVDDLGNCGGFFQYNAMGMYGIIRNGEPVRSKPVVVEPTPEPEAVVKSKPTMDECLESLRQIPDATSEHALTLGIPSKNDGDTFVAHLFCSSYDCWVKSYSKRDRTFFGFCSFGGPNDMCAEYGYVSIDELLAMKPYKVERDLYWDPCTLDELQNPDTKSIEKAAKQLAEVIKDEAVTHVPGEHLSVKDGELTISKRDLLTQVFGADAIIDATAELTHQDELVIAMEGPEAISPFQCTRDRAIEIIKAKLPAFTIIPILSSMASFDELVITKDLLTIGGNEFDWSQVWNHLNLNDEGKKRRNRKAPSLSFSDPFEEDNNNISDIVDRPFNKAESLPKQTPVIPARTYEPKAHIQIGDRPSELTVRETLNMTAPLFETYSGRGKLHPIIFEGNFHDYTKAKQEFEMGEFYTSDKLCQSIVKLCEINKFVNVMDPNCATGRFFNWCPNVNNITGMDIDEKAINIARKTFPDANFRERNMYRLMDWRMGDFDYILGNPPFNITDNGHYDHPLASNADEEDGGKGNVLSQNQFIHLCKYYLRNGGIATYIVPDTFLECARDTKVKAYVNEHFYHIATIRLGNNAFSEYQIKFPTKVIVMMKKHDDLKWTLPTIETTFEDFYKTEQGQWFYNSKKLIDDGERIRLFTSHKSKAIFEDVFNNIHYKLLKKIAEYKQCKNFKEDKLQEFRGAYTNINQSYKDDVIVVYGKLIKEVTRAIKHQYKHELYVRIYPTSYKIRFERSNPVVSQYINGIKGDGDYKYESLPLTMDKNDFRVKDLRENTLKKFNYWMSKLMGQQHIVKYHGEDTKINIIYELGDNYLTNLGKQWDLNNTPTSELKNNYDIQYSINMEKLDELVFGDKTLLPHQKEDLAGILMKNYALISWDTGLGKTLGGIAYTYIKGGKTLVLAPSMNTMDPWKQQLQEYVPDRSVFLCKTSKDITKYKGEDYLICSIENAPNVYQSLKRIRFSNLIVDESDNLKSKTSSRAKTIKALSRKIKRKLLMSGTPTRNNILEIYNQIELLCRNSTNMLCYAKTWEEYDRGSREYMTQRNPNHMKPFPAWGGHKAFERTFSPRKVTCFGANETNQDILHTEEFKRMVEPIRFTRIYDEEKPRINEALGIAEINQYKEWKQVIVPMSEHEGKVYEWILDEFAKMVEQHYRAIHDGATASKLVIMRQILELLQGTSHPWTYLNYEGPKVGTKLLKALEIIEQAKTEGRKVMMASPWRDTADGMEAALVAKGYPVFRIESEMSKTQRAKLVHEFRNWPGFAVITGTMGCLKSGLNLPEVSVVIAESYTWNMAQLKQYAARAIRLNSKEKTIIHCLCSEGSFDVNVFGLLVKKEVTNEFVRTSEIVSTGEIRKELGVKEEDDFYQAALRMVRERVNGSTRGSIKWHEEAVYS